MQDRYTGDVGDFGKYGLLRCLRGPDAAPLRLGVVWYRTDSDIVDADPVNDGKHVAYSATAGTSGRSGPAIRPSTTGCARS